MSWNTRCLPCSCCQVTIPLQSPLTPPIPLSLLFPPRPKTKRSTGKAKNKPNGQKQGHNKQKQSREQQQQQQATHRSQETVHTDLPEHLNLHWVLVCACLAVSPNLCKKSKKADSTLGTSQAVPHPSTIRALCHLTSEVGRDPVYLTRYGRQRNLRIDKTLRNKGDQPINLKL